MIRLRAFAKLNLALAVRGVRDDGFHEIDSLVQTIDLADRITVRLSCGKTHVVSDLIGLTGRDLAEVAAESILQAKGRSEGAMVEIVKGIPTGAGLGGGSADAAAVLIALDCLTDEPMEADALRDLAAGIGSDVPLFLEGGRCRMRGRGERVARQDSVEPVTYVLLIPPLHCDTRTVYKRWDALAEPSSEELVLGVNGLRMAALSAYPQLEAYDVSIRAVGGLYEGMSGSGATFFAAFSDPIEADGAAEALRREHPDARVERCSATMAGQEILEGGAT